jgi:hypothetical protein
MFHDFSVIKDESNKISKVFGTFSILFFSYKGKAYKYQIHFVIGTVVKLDILRSHEGRHTKEPVQVNFMYKSWKSWLG